MPDLIETRLIGPGIVILRQIVMFGHPEICGCDAKCHKAFGINGRPNIRFDPNCDDDTAMLADDEVPDAPQFPGTWEGSDGKPIEAEDRLNKWCIRECERSERAKPGEMLTAPDFSKRSYNQPWKHKEANS